MSQSSLTAVVALDKNNGIGVANELPWHLPEDLAHFKRVTSGHAIVMGRNTFESIGRPLPNRRNIVITRNPEWKRDGVETASSVSQAISMLGEAGGFIIGGGQVFEEAMPLVQTLVVTEIDKVFPCDTFFPRIDPAQWKETAREQHHSDKSGLDFAIVTYQRSAQRGEH
jgi:dihydrofolate reductase